MALIDMMAMRAPGTMLGISPPPKLIVCDLDQDVLGKRDTESDVLENWMAWNDANRPLLLLHSKMPLDELQRRLLTTTLPPADFLIGAGTSLLVRFTQWQAPAAGQAPEPGPWADLDPHQLIEAILSQARLEMKNAEAASSDAFPTVQSAALTTSGLLVTFGAPARRARRRDAGIALGWILNQLKFDPGDVCIFARPGRTAAHRLRMAGR
jgi:hypothetical protein